LTATPEIQIGVITLITGRVIKLSGAELRAAA